MNKAYQYYKELPSWAKGVVVVGGIAIAYFTAKQLIARIKKAGQIEKEMQTINEQKKEVDILVKSGVKPTFTSSQYKAWADAIQSQFDGCDSIPKIPILPAKFLGLGNWSGSGTKFVQIIAQFKNDLDFLNLSTAWGIRTYDQCGWGTGDVTGSLAKAVADELDDNEIVAINKVLAKQGLTYRF